MSKLALELIRENKKTKSITLDLGKCGMTEVPEEIGELVWLEELILSDDWFEYNFEEKRWDQRKSQNEGEANKIQYLPPTLPFLVLLKKINLSESKVSDLSPIANLRNLQQLNCYSTEIRDLDQLGNLASLNTLFIPGTNISDLSSIVNLNSLQIINLHNTKVHDLSPLANLISLKLLYCSSSQISDLSPIAGLTNLQLLYCKSTQISDLSPIGELTNLQELDCSSTQISDLSPIGELTNLQELDCSFTQISDLSPIAALTNLRRLKCNSTQISDLSPILPLIKSGKQVKWEAYEGDIRVNDCPLVHPPVEVVKQGNEAILEYFARIEQDGTQELLEAKVILIGEGMAGKTSLRNRLLGRPMPNKPDRTKGLDIEVEPYRFPLSDGKEMQLNLFDFGGQDHYKPLHQFFYSKRSLYLLVTKNGDDQNDFDFWLDTAKLHGDGSPLLVINNLFGNVKCNFNYEQWAKGYPFVKASFEVNLDSQEGLEPLKRQIEAYAMTLPHIRQPLPRSWAAIREKLKARKADENFIHLKDYLEICGDQGIHERSSALHLSRYLHDIGSFLHFQDNEVLRKWVILRNEWATEAVYRVLDDADIIRQKGHFSPDNLKRVWSAEEYEDMRDALLELMMEFRLCYPKPDGKHFIAPSLLPTEPPVYVWPSDPETRMIRIEYVFMPRVLFTQLIVAEHEKIEDGRLCVWRSGSVFSKSTARVEARQVGKNALEFRAQGKGMVELLTILNDTLDGLHELTPGIEVERLIPCICTKCRQAEKPYFFKKSRLDHRLNNNRPKDECQISFEELDIEEMLGHVLLKKEDLGKNKREDGAKTSSAKPMKVFISYSHKDEAFKTRFDTALKPLKRLDLIDVWQDRQLLAGEEFEKTIFSEIDKADIVCLLISPSFIESDYCFTKEMEAALQQKQTNGTIVIPIILRSTPLWHKFEIGSLNALPKDGRHVTDWPDQDAAWTDIVQKIHELIENKSA